jgi:hypothetical protein
MHQPEPDSPALPDLPENRASLEEPHPAMSVFCIILAACLILLLGAVAFLVMVVVGVRKGDRGDLTPAPRNRLDSITRRVLGVGVLSCDSDSEHGGKG